MLRIYVQDRGVYGMIVVVAKSEREARLMMCCEFNYLESEAVESYEIEDGFIYCCLGDM